MFFRRIICCVFWVTDQLRNSSFCKKLKAIKTEKMLKCIPSFASFRWKTLAVFLKLFFCIKHTYGSTPNACFSNYLIFVDILYWCYLGGSCIRWLLKTILTISGRKQDWIWRIVLLVFSCFNNCLINFPHLAGVSAGTVLLCLKYVAKRFTKTAIVSPSFELIASNQPTWHISAWRLTATNIFCATIKPRAWKFANTVIARHKNTATNRRWTGFNRSYLWEVVLSFL